MTLTAGASPPISGQPAATRHASSTTNAPSSWMTPVCSARSMKAPGGEQPAHGVLPADERLDEPHAAVAQVDDRLEAQRQLPAADRAPQVGRQLGAHVGVGEHLGPEALDAIAAAALGGVHREVGAAQQALVVGARRPHGDADARAHHALAVADAERLAQRRAQALGGRLGAGLVRRSSCRSTANSSPPRRPATSPWRRHSRIRRAATVSSSSPASCPSVSLTSLKPSRSR